MSDKPKAWRSPLREHLPEIRRMRKARHTWQEITDHLTTRHGIRLTRSALCHFFRRAKRRSLPMGFEDPPIECEGEGETSKPTASATEQSPQNEGISLTPVNQQKRGNWFGYDPEQGIRYVPKN
jgi:hypothetical protein